MSHDEQRLDDALLCDDTTLDAKYENTGAPE
jgi:hypothetical protein